MSRIRYGYDEDGCPQYEDEDDFDILPDRIAIGLDNMIGACHICKSALFRNEREKWFYWAGLFVCQKHHGAKAWHEEKLMYLEKQLEEKEIAP